jgi:hypothetical protein
MGSVVKSIDLTIFCGRVPYISPLNHGATSIDAVFASFLCDIGMATK